MLCSTDHNETVTNPCKKTIIGKCSKCGGNVMIHNVWMSVGPYVPQCESCGAKKKNNLPVVEME